MRVLSAGLQGNDNPERPLRTRRVGRAAMWLAPVAAAAALLVVKNIADAQERADENAMLHTLNHGKTVTLPALPREVDETYLGRIYEKIPSNVYPALKKKLDGEEAQTGGELEAGAGYQLPYGGQGLVLKPAYQAIADQREAEAQKQHRDSPTPGQ